MFTSFFYLLRARGLKVSLNEWMSLIEALDKGLHGSSFTGFYYLCRSVLVKSEADFDKFDGAFLEFFKDMELTDELPQELLDWLENPKEKPGEEFDMDRAMQNEWLSQEEIQRMFLERLQEQKEEHNGGSYWVGTAGSARAGYALAAKAASGGHSRLQGNGNSGIFGTTTRWISGSSKWRFDGCGSFPQKQMKPAQNLTLTAPSAKPAIMPGISRSFMSARAKTP